MGGRRRAACAVRRRARRRARYRARYRSRVAARRNGMLAASASAATPKTAA
jgi:hypothetical protein